MAEYIEREALIERLNCSPMFPNFGEDGFFVREAVIDIIRKQPTKPAAAVAEVVRCKECKHLYFKDFSAYCPHTVSACHPDDFCSYGERKDEG